MEKKQTFMDYLVFRVMCLRTNPYLLIGIFLFLLLQTLYLKIMFPNYGYSLLQTFLFLISIIIIFDVLLEIIMDTQFNKSQKKTFIIYNRIFLLPLSLPLIGAFLTGNSQLYLGFLSPFIVFALLFELIKSIRWTTILTTIYIIVIGGLSFNIIYGSFFVFSAILLFGIRYCEVNLGISVEDKNLDSAINISKNYHKKKKEFVNSLNLKGRQVLFSKDDIYYLDRNNFFDKFNNDVQDSVLKEELKKLVYLKNKFMELEIKYSFLYNFLGRYPDEIRNFFRLMVSKIYNKSVKNEKPIIMLLNRLTNTSIMGIIFNKKLMQKVALKGHKNYDLIPDNWKKSDDRRLWKSDYNMDIALDVRLIDEYIIKRIITFFQIYPSMEYIKVLREMIIQTRSNSKKFKWKKIVDRRFSIAAQKYSNRPRIIGSYRSVKRSVYQFLKYIGKIDYLINNLDSHT